MLSIIAILVACNDDIVTNPSLDFPRGTPNAKAFDNLQLVRSLEKKQRQNTLLIIISTAGANQEGSVIEGSAWSYFFGVLENNVERTFIWKVWADGIVEYVGLAPYHRPYNIIELGPVLKINSDAAIKIARHYGAKEYFNKYPNAAITMNYIWKYSQAIVTVSLYDPYELGECEPEWLIKSDTGELLHTNVENCI
ncbi:MAG: hypothetical protein A2Y62_19820 [Candidatus Fischerbacteria bacterium RBG_13_37_8]|uniref:Uncharacterized protein n=1 Tax=Candidatus Fischerbacteria bacterium RBG_13_37_8 TaxID=1817863 RepID=A0A1F5VL90_9BACT|nr:MAG: hypothetical protein A2Y62_19820 [Candidatus Fischerbacteria bacterium RBG_13_37_8]